MSWQTRFQPSKLTFTAGMARSQSARTPALCRPSSSKGVLAMRTTARERRAEALTRAVTGQTLSNYPAIFQGFMVMGIAEAEGLDGQPIAD